jgi:ABC-type long-subunit fatty acid transport system fused permease/ATPase subunit
MLLMKIVSILEESLMIGCAIVKTIMNILSFVPFMKEVCSVLSYLVRINYASITLFEDV